MASRDLREDPTAKLWVKNVLDDMAPKMAESAVVAQLVPDDPEADVWFWVELGASIMMNKPIVAIVLGDRVISPKLELIADEVVRLPEGIDPAGAEELQAAIKRVVGDG